MKGIPDEIVAFLREQITERQARLDFIPSAGLRREHQADYAGKTLIIHRCVEVLGGVDLAGYPEVPPKHDFLAVTLAVETLRALALPFAGQSGFRGEWHL